MEVSRKKKISDFAGSWEMSDAEVHIDRKSWKYSRVRSDVTHDDTVWRILSRRAISRAWTNEDRIWYLFL